MYLAIEDWLKHKKLQCMLYIVLNNKLLQTKSDSEQRHYMSAYITKYLPIFYNLIN